MLNNYSYDVFDLNDISEVSAILNDPDLIGLNVTIPYKETREYVASIIRNYFWYSKRINGTSSAPGGSDKSLAYFWNVYGPPEKPAALPEVR